jgi:soluble lytic murein transglycosylase-like protein
VNVSKRTLIPIAQRIARDHDLDPALVCAICHQESSWRPWAIRYEPGYRWLFRLGGSLPRHGASEATERAQQMTSWGLMQVMGAVAREHGCEEPFLTVLCDPAVGIEHGCRHLVQLTRRYGDQGLEAVISAYNAGRPTERNREHYVKPVLRFINLYRREIT